MWPIKETVVVELITLPKIWTIFKSSWQNEEDKRFLIVCDKPGSARAGLFFWSFLNAGPNFLYLIFKKSLICHKEAPCGLQQALADRLNEEESKSTPSVMPFLLTAIKYASISYSYLMVALSLLPWFPIIHLFNLKVFKVLIMGSVNNMSLSKQQ